MRSLRVSLFLAAVMVLNSATLVWSQAVAVAQLSGAVIDTSGAAIQNAQVRVIQTDMGLERITTSGKDGIYVLPNLPVGPYKLVVTASGFRTYSRSGIDLPVSAKINVDVTMAVGSVSQEVVEVRSDAGLIEVGKTSVSNVIDESRIVDLPLNGRVSASLVVLTGATGAAINGNGGQYDLTPQGNLGKLYATEVPYTVGGSQPNANNWLLDGADHNDTFENVAQPYPFPDALREFSVDTGVISARLGLHPGAVINMVTKSGSNRFHGDLFEFLRNGSVNALNYFATAQDTLKRNQFGGTIGGPIIKDKLFFFAGYQRTTLRTDPPASTSHVPTAADLAGDFSAAESANCQSNGVARTLIDPATGTPFPNNQVPTGSFNPIALNLVNKYVPLSSDPCGKTVYGIPDRPDEDMILGRMDWVHSAKQTFFGRYFYSNWNDPPEWNGKDLLPAQRKGIRNRFQGITLSDTYVLNPTTINSARFTISRLGTNRGAPANYIGPQDIGLNNCKPGACASNYVALSINGHFSTGGPGINLHMGNDSIQVGDDLDLIRGRHHISLGFEYFRNATNLHSGGISNGSYSFDGSFTGDALVDFLLGDPNEFSQGAPNLQNWRQNVLGLYADDVLRVNSRLTLTAGIRWDPFFPETDKYGRGDYFDLAAFNAGIKTTRYQFAPPGLLYNSDPGVPHAYTNNHLANFAPRLSISWDPTGKGSQVVRASYGISYDTPGIFYFNQFATTAPWSSTVNVLDPPGGLSNPWAGFPGGNPYPVPIPPVASSPFPADGAYQTLPLNLHNSYVQQWLLSYEHQFSANWLFTATYIGNKTTHFWISSDLNPAVYIPGTCNGQPCSTVANTEQRRVLALRNPVSGSQYSDLYTIDDGGNASYHGLLLSIRHRFSNHFTILSNYTYSHCISEADSQGEVVGDQLENPFDPSLDRGNCEFDLRHILNTSVVATSPSFTSQWARRLLGNWQLSPVISVSSGPWFSAWTGFDNSLTGMGWDRPNLILSSPYPAHQTVSQWLNAAAFVPNALGTYGNIGRNSLLGPGAVNFDIAVSRSFPLGETRRIEARFEAFNVINHPNFGLPDNTLADSQFGQITTASDPRILQAAFKFLF
jgi:hypothetical protein